VIQIPLFEPPSDWVPPESFPDPSGATAIGIDTETYDPHITDIGPGWSRDDGFLAGISLAFQKGKDIQKLYLPVRHEAGGNLDLGQVKRYVQDVCKTPTLKLFHNASYDMGWLGTEGIEVSGPFFDTGLGASLADENRLEYNLDAVAKDFIGQGKDETLLREAGAAWGLKTTKQLKANMWRMPPRFVGPYAEQDAAVLLPLRDRFLEIFNEEDLNQIAELEMNIIPLTFEMCRQGVRIDMDKAERVKKLLEAQKADELKAIKRDYGLYVDIWSAESLAQIFDRHKLPYPRTPKTNAPSFKKEFLEGLTHPLGGAIRHLRKLDKTINTFLVGMMEKHYYKGRVHPEFCQLKGESGGTITGRYSCRNPNLQQATGRDAEFSPHVRGMFLPEEGERWGAFDYKAQEPRLTVHYAYITHQDGAEEAVRRYNEDPDTDYHQMVADFTNLSRADAKEINLGVAYGMGPPLLCAKLGLPTEWILRGKKGWEKVEAGTPGSFEVAGPEGKHMMETYHQKVPFIKGLSSLCDSKAQQRGWIKTLLGRRGRFPFYEKNEFTRYPKLIRGYDEAVEFFQTKNIKRAKTHKSMNKLIQGGAADQTKAAMYLLYKEGIIPLNQMHDELDVSIGSKKKYLIVEEIMRTAVELVVPIFIDCEFGENWGNAKNEWS